MTAFAEIAPQESLEVYHSGADGHVTRSAIKVLINKGPYTYHETFISRRVPPPKPEAKFMIGTGSHTLILEPEKFEATVKLIPANKLASNGARSGNKYKDFCSENDGCILLKPDEYDMVRWMADQVLKEARAVIDAVGEIERTIRWVDPATGVNCKCRPDKLCTEARIAADLKTAADVSRDAFAAAAARFGYDEQQSWYSDGVEQKYGWRPDFIFIAVEKTPPFRTRVFEFDRESGDLDLAWRRNHGALEELRRRTDEDDWTDPDSGQVIPFSLPRWARQRIEWSE